MKKLRLAQLSWWKRKLELLLPSCNEHWPLLKITVKHLFSSWYSCNDLSETFVTQRSLWRHERNFSSILQMEGNQSSQEVPMHALINWSLTGYLLYMSRLHLYIWVDNTQEQRIAQSDSVSEAARPLLEPAGFSQFVLVLDLSGRKYRFKRLAPTAELKFREANPDWIRIGFQLNCTPHHDLMFASQIFLLDFSHDHTNAPIIS